MSAQCHFQALILRAARVIIIIATSISVGKSNFQCGVANFCDDLMPGLIDENCAGIFYICCNRSHGGGIQNRLLYSANASLRLKHRALYNNIQLETDLL